MTKVASKVFNIRAVPCRGDRRLAPPGRKASGPYRSRSRDNSRRVCGYGLTSGLPSTK